jgi:hypothetical protein
MPALATDIMKNSSAPKVLKSQFDKVPTPAILDRTLLLHQTGKRKYSQL